jgi:hypothetical protein
MEWLTGVIAMIGAVTFILQTFLYGRFSGKDDARGHPPRGDRIIASLLRAAALLDRIRKTRARTFARRAFYVIAVIALLPPAYFGYAVLDYAVFGGDLPGGHDSGSPFSSIFELLLLVMTGFFALAVVITLVLIQWLLFGLFGRRALLVVVLDYMGHHTKGVLQTSGTVVGLFSAFTVLLGTS